MGMEGGERRYLFEGVESSANGFFIVVSAAGGLASLDQSLDHCFGGDVEVEDGGSRGDLECEP